MSGPVYGVSPLKNLYGPWRDAQMREQLDALFASAHESRLRNLEMLAAAYLKETGIPASECELIERIEEGQISWHFERRKT